MKRKPNLIFLGIDSLRRDHMSLYGYPRLTTPHIDRYAAGGAVFEKLFSPSIPTTPGYSSMLTGMDCFGTNVVALGHKGPIASPVKTLPEILGQAGYNTTCVGFTGNPASRGFQKYFDFDGWFPSEATGRCHKAENLNAVALPEMKRLAGEKKPFFLFVRHMDPHAPYLPPAPYERAFYGGNELDKKNKSLAPALAFKPFRDFLASWLPDGCTDTDYVDAQYDGSIAYMDACIASIFAQISALGIQEETLVVITSDHGETLNEHDCFYDHHGLYECTLTVPLALVWPGQVPVGTRCNDICTTKDITPTILDLMGLRPQHKLDGRSLRPLLGGKGREPEPEFYITECTWMRKHGWRTPQWKYIRALEPDFHFKPEVELYDLVRDPGETSNLAKKEPAMVAVLEARMQAWIQKREKETGRKNPMYTNLEWSGGRPGPFKTSQEAYDTQRIGSIKAAVSLQKKERTTRRVKKK